MMLYPVVKDVEGTVYCGPTAIGAITGYPISTVYQELSKEVTLPIIGLRYYYILRCLLSLGFRIKRVNFDNNMELHQFFYQHEDGPYLLATSKHYIAYSEGEVVDVSNDYPLYWRTWGHRNKYIREEVSYWVRLTRIE